MTIEWDNQGMSENLGAMGEIVDTTQLKEAKKLREQELTEDILRYTEEGVKDYVRDRIEELLKLK